MIVKIQLPQNEMAAPFALVYNEDKSFMTFVNIEPGIIKAMKGKLKSFFEVVVDDPVNKKFIIQKDAPDQEW